MSSQPLRVLGLVFPNFNILDLTGPAEIFGNSRIAANERSLIIASATADTSSSEGIVIKRQASFEQILNDLSAFDILVVPGAHPSFIQNALDKREGLLDIIKAFVDQAVSSSKEKYLLSVCTGAILVGASGLLNGRTVTTHWCSLDFLKRVCSNDTNIIRKRFVDAGKIESGVRIITAGGVSCGIDAALWIAGNVYGREKALEVAASMDYKWEFGGAQEERTEGWSV